MTESLPATTIADLRQRSAVLREKARKAMLPESKRSFDDLAEMYAEMARSVEQLEMIQAQMREHR